MQKGGGRDRERGGLEQKKPPLSGEKGPEPFYSRYTTLSHSGRGGEQNARKEHKKNNFSGVPKQMRFYSERTRRGEQPYYTPRSQAYYTYPGGDREGG